MPSLGLMGPILSVREAPAPTGAVAVSSLPSWHATAAGMLPWARGFAVLYTTHAAAWMPSLSLRGLFLAAKTASCKTSKSDVKMEKGSM